jgi:two-component system alkaline phosphatase synthesis response regulator PhoP
MSLATSPYQSGAATRRRRILAIDDDEGLLDMLALLLSQSHLDLRTAVGGEAGLKLAMTWDPDLILLDLAMPGVDGPAFLKRYRRTATSPAPVVLLTGALDGLARATEMDVTMFLPKPFDLGILVEIVDAYSSAKAPQTAWA